MTGIGAVVAIGVALVLLDRLLLKAEGRGWVFYRKRQASTGSVSGAAFGAVFDVLQPERQVYVAEMQHHELMREDPESGRDEDPECSCRSHA